MGKRDSDFPGETPLGLGREWEHTAALCLLLRKGFLLEGRELVEGWKSDLLSH